MAAPPLMGLLGAIGIFFSEAPWPAGMATLSLLTGTLLALRESRRPRRVLVVGADGRATLDGDPLSDLTLHWRGPLAFVAARDAAGRMHRLAWWPDTLDRAARRTLKRAVPPPRPSPRGMRR